MRLAIVAVALSLLLSGCASKKHAVRAAAPPPSKQSMQPVMRRQVLNAVDAGEGNPRVKALRERMAAEPKNVKLRIELSAEYGKSGYPEMELDHLRLAVERFPASQAALVALSRTLVRAKQPAEAERRLNEYMAKWAKPSVNVLSWAAIVRDEMGKWKDGEKFHRQALERGSGRDTLHNNLGYNLMMQGRKSEAAEEFRRALDLNPSSETARNNLGMAMGDQPAAAISQFRQSADLAVAHNNLATYLYEKGDMAGARKELEMALEYRKDLPQIMENLRRLSAADGIPIRLPGREPRTFWKTFGLGLKHSFISGDERSTIGTVEAAR